MALFLPIRQPTSLAGSKRYLTVSWKLSPGIGPIRWLSKTFFFATNPQSALKLGQARGAAIVAAVHSGLPVAEYSALQVKQAVVGQGKAEKEQVQKMLKALLGLPEIAQADASDALAVAICHINSYGLKQISSGTVGTKRQKTSWRDMKL